MGLGNLNPGCGCRCGQTVNISCGCNLFYQNCYLSWGCFGKHFCGTRLLYGTQIVSQSQLGLIYAPDAGVWTIQVCCINSQGERIWSDYTSVTVPPTRCSPCSCFWFTEPIYSLTIAEPGIFSMFDGTYSFTTPGCSPCQLFTFTAPSAQPANSNWIVDNNLAPFEQWMSKNPQIRKDTYTTAFGTTCIHYYWPQSVHIGASLGGLGPCPPNSGTDMGLMVADGLNLTTSPGGTRSAFVGSFSAYHRYNGTTACTLTWWRQYNLKTFANIIANPRITAVDNNPSEMATCYTA